MMSFRQTVLFIGSILLSRNISVNADATNLALDKQTQQSMPSSASSPQRNNRRKLSTEYVLSSGTNVCGSAALMINNKAECSSAGDAVGLGSYVYSYSTSYPHAPCGCTFGYSSELTFKPCAYESTLYANYDALCRVPNEAGGSAIGDPHFRTFQNIFFSYHAACDILLLNSIIHKVMVQIRTTRVDTHRRHQSSYSYISQAAVKIQDVILEVSADGNLLINGEDSSDSVPASIADGYAGLTKTIKGTKGNIISYKVDLGNGRSIDLRSNMKTAMMYIDVDGHFSDSEGLLGPSGGKDGLYSRDGTIMDMAAEGAYNSYSQSWQVTSDEPMLFQEARFPQNPVGCSYTAVPATASTNLRRRLTDVVEVSKDDAMKACANAVPGDKMDFCVTDVMLTGDLDAAEDEFYYLN